MRLAPYTCWAIPLLLAACEHSATKRERDAGAEAAAWSGADCATPDCSNVSCGSNGSCQISGGVAACGCAQGFGGPACDYIMVYALDIGTHVNWNVASDVPYSVDNSAQTGLFDRVGYQLTLDDQKVWVDVEAFTVARDRLGVPTDWTWDRSFTDMTVRSNVAGVSEVDHASGNMEFWSDCYGNAPNSSYDYDDTPSGTDCHGSLQLFQGTQTLLAVNAWAGNQATVSLGIGTQATGEPDWTFASNAAQFTTRRLEVYVRAPNDCSGSPCTEHGTCAANGGNVTCQCAATWAGPACERCDLANGYGDLDGNGTCEQGCENGVCFGLASARGLTTGTYAMSLLGGESNVYIDGSYDGGGWVLIGRGREDWAWNNTGMGLPSDVPMDLGTPGAFAPKYLSAAVIQNMIDSTPGPLDLRDLDLRIKRAADLTGTQSQEVLWKFQTETLWNWDFPSQQQIVQQTVLSSVLGSGGTFSGSVRDIGSNDQTRVFTWAWDGHDNKMGFSYGNSLSNGDDMATSFLWMKAGANHPLPYSEVYLRLPPCAADPCNSHGTCSVGANGPICMCDPPYSGETCAIVGAADGTSCLDILTRFPASPSGTHGIDPDGNGPLPTFSAFCDMTTNGGGWTTIGNDTFESGSATGWSSGSVDSSCPTAFTKFLGGATQFAMGSSTQRVFDLMQMPHTEALISLDFIVLDSWDGEQAIVSVDSTELYNMSFSHGGGGDVCGAGFNDLGPQPVSSQLAHTGNSLTLQVTSTLDQDPSDESWAIDNVRVMIR